MSGTGRIGLVAALALVACDRPAPGQAPPAETATPSPTPAGEEVARPGFRVTVPAGFQLHTDEKVLARMPAGSLALAATERRPDGARPSIVIVPLDQPMPGAEKIATLGGCIEHTRQLAATASAAAAGVDRPRLVTAGTAPACSWELLGDGRLRAIGTFVPRGDHGWVITCNLAHDDAAAIAACRAVVASWRFEPTP